MPKGPSVIIIVRHGARLDASDKTWHLTSPTPYDPPLTYGGWSQEKALGLRIASLLHAREEEADKKKAAANVDLAHLEFSALDGANGKKDHVGEGILKRKRRQRVVLHSSPYLRCIQTSTAIAAGISQFQPLSAPPTKHAHFADSEKNGHSPLVPAVSKSSSSVRRAPIVEPVADPSLQVFQKPHNGPEKILLRIDAFLGEWLSPDYFEDITPPPNSTMMLAGAKADLLRRGEYVEVQPHAQNTRGHFPGGWAKTNGASTSSNHSAVHDAQSFPSMGSLASVLPRERASSQGSVASHSSRTSIKGATSLATAHKVPDHIYDPPVPSYAVSPSDPIPRGYVQHARDACIDIDFQWDSMRAPQEWGDGGEYGDEWSTMHKRFRKGLGKMMNWYKEHGHDFPEEKISGFTYKEHTAKTPTIDHHSSDPGPATHDAEDEDEDLILVLVTHGAGCNALLGAISNQPVLLDIGLASLSMAVQRDEPGRSSVASYDSARRSSIIDLGLSDQYELKMLASVDHLRPGVDPRKLSTPQIQSPTVVPSPSMGNRRRFDSPSTNSPIDSPFSIGQPYRTLPSSLGSMRRSSTSGSSSSRFYTNSVLAPTPTSTVSGLWSGLRTPTPQEPLTPAGGHSPGQDLVNSFAMQKPKLNNIDTSVSPSTAPLALTKSTSIENENDDVPPLPTSLGASLSPFTTQGLWGPKSATVTTGLWGSTKEVERAPGPKRRWTVSQQD